MPWCLVMGFTALVGGVACTVDSAKNHLSLAEKLWSDREYAAAVGEYEKVWLKDPQGKLGMKALYEAGQTQGLFLGQPVEALQKLQQYVHLGGPRAEHYWEAQEQIGDLLFLKLERYEQAIPHYQALIDLGPERMEVPEFLFRIAKSYFLRFQFAQAINTYRQVLSRYPESSWAEQSEFEIGSSELTAEHYNLAQSAFQGYLHHYPHGHRRPEAEFGLASCWEGLDHLPEAYQLYSGLLSQHPSPRTILIKLARMKERLAAKGFRESK